jgi:hypothetical protein
MKEFVLRGQTASGLTHTMNFSGHKGDYGFRLIDFKLWPSTDIGTKNGELSATLTAAKTYEDPSNPNFDNEGLIGTSLFIVNLYPEYGNHSKTLINDTFIVTQDLILAVVDTFAGAPMAVNWQCKFMPVKLSSTEAALTNYRQFSIFDE